MGGSGNPLVITINGRAETDGSGCRLVPHDVAAGVQRVAEHYCRPAVSLHSWLLLRLFYTLNDQHLDGMLPWVQFESKLLLNGRKD